MDHQLGLVSVVVSDYDEAIRFYCDVLGFELIEDTIMSDIKRWVVVKPRGKGHGGLLLAKAANSHQETRVGDQTGGRVFLFLYTDNIERDQKMLLDHQVSIVRPMTHETYGKVLVFADLYGNLWDLIERVS
jgi:catechol 2,3-dioxygenase-like lactoylglutathione lyase family enzyme